MASKLSTLEDVENRLSDHISEIRSRFPAASNYSYSTDNIIAQSLGLDVTEQTGIEDDGYFVDEKIVINSDITYMERKNFSLFHEITHYLISTDEEIISFLMDYHAGREKGFQRYIESLCNFGAGEFLAPIGQIKDQIQEDKFSITLIKKLDKLFPASKPAIIFQLARAASHKCTLVVVDRRVLSSAPDHQQNGFGNRSAVKYKYYILYSATSKRNKYRPGRYTLIPKHHVLRNAYEEQSVIMASDFIPYKSGNRNHICDCEAMYYRGKVYGLFNLERPMDSKLQPKLF